jgi:hypothetical protein
VSGAPADGVFDFTFTLFDAATAGVQVAPPVSAPGLEVQQGRFSATLDFGSVWTGAPRFLEIAVRSAGAAGGYTALSPRQAVTPVPYAIGAQQVQPEIVRLERQIAGGPDTSYTGARWMNIIAGMTSSEGFFALSAPAQERTVRAASVLIARAANINYNGTVSLTLQVRDLATDAVKRTLAGPVDAATLSVRTWSSLTLAGPATVGPGEYLAIAFVGSGTVGEFDLGLDAALDLE